MFAILFILFATKLFLVANSHVELYPFGAAHSDSSLRRGDDAMTAISDLPYPLPVFGELHNAVFITTDGLISLSAPPLSSSPQLSPTTGDLIAPFWADVDTTLRGQVWFRVTSDEKTLQRAKEQLNDRGMCTPLYLIIATWDDVGYYRNHYDKGNTFQCILATDGNSSFATFVYKQNGIQWTTGDASGGTFGVLTELNGVAAVVGVFSRRAHKHNTMPLSGTQNVSTIWNTSNTNIPGVWIFDLGLGAEQAVCIPHQENRKSVLTTLIPVVILCAVLLLLWLGVIYGYCRIGRYILAQNMNKTEVLIQDKSISAS